MRQAQFPDGDIVILGPGMLLSVSGANVAVNYLGSALKTYACVNAAGAQSLAAQLAATPDLTTGISTPLTDPSATPVITSVTPSPLITPAPFNPITDTVIILGTGFRPDNLGKLYIEDNTGGFDANGLSMTCTFVSATELTAVFANKGDNNPFNADGTSTGGAVIVGYKTSDGIKSNGLMGDVDGANNVTMR